MPTTRSGTACPGARRLAAENRVIHFSGASASRTVCTLAPVRRVRDAIMAEGTVAMLEQFPSAGSAVVVMGRAHCAGYERNLIERFGFVHAKLFDV